MHACAVPTYTFLETEISNNYVMSCTLFNIMHISFCPKLVPIIMQAFTKFWQFCDFVRSAMQLVTMQILVRGLVWNILWLQYKIRMLHATNAAKFGNQATG